MIGLIIAIIIFNIIAFKTNKNLTANQIIHIWLFTITLQKTFDVFVDLKFHGYPSITLSVYRENKNSTYTQCNNTDQVHRY